MNIIETHNISKVYENEGTKTDALRKVTLAVAKGEFIAIMGPSGSGKSTLLQILGLLDSHTDGSYMFAGKDISSYSQEEIAKIRNGKMGFVFQAFNLLPHATVLENVKLPLFYSDIPEEEWDVRAEEAVIDVGLEHRIEHQATQLSGGEKQRVAIARALVCDPEVIFADEPTGNLDSKSGEAVIDIIQKLNTEMGHTVVLITHETYTAEYAQRIIRLHDGEIVADEPVKNRKTVADAFQK
ncbi:MAG: ABC transporter ATP-binding protein [Patescibacteria group bacterium]|nr:ABC transporter ATP-binding protein [Patescibacteria group bacterium]MDE1945888.1 ABC transporter ATP-binding protein [Patescibacteria group bacterium]